MVDEDLPFYGRLAPSEERFWWNGVERTVTVRVLTDGEEAALRDMVAARPEEERFLAHLVERLAQAIVDIDGQPVRARLPALRDRLDWIRQWPTSLLSAVLDVYTQAAQRPHTELLRLLQDEDYRMHTLVRWRVVKHCQLLAGRELTAEEWAFATLHTAKDVEDEAQQEWLRRQVRSHLALLIQHDPQEAVRRLRQDKKPGEPQYISEEELLARFLTEDTFFSDRRPLSEITKQPPPWKTRPAPQEPQPDQDQPDSGSHQDTPQG